MVLGSHSVFIAPSVLKPFSSGNVLALDSSYILTKFLNATLEFIVKKGKRLQNEKTEQILFKESLPGGMPMTGLEPALSCLK